MNLPVRDLLDRRTATPVGRRRAFGVAGAVVVHVLIAALFVLAPRLAAKDRALPEYVAVQIVPARMLGTSTPTPPQPRPPTPEPRQPEPEPEPQPPDEPDVEPTSSAPPPPEPKPRKAEPRPTTPDENRRPSPPGTLSQREGSPTGSRLGTSNFGAAVGFDNPDFTYDYYVDRMLAGIREHWVRPPLGGRVEAMISFRILADGKVVDVSIARSSGYNSFDLAALRAVQSASPLPRLPQTFDHQSLGVNLVVR